MPGPRRSSSKGSGRPQPWARPRSITRFGHARWVPCPGAARSAERSGSRSAPPPTQLVPAASRHHRRRSTPGRSLRCSPGSGRIRPTSTASPPLALSGVGKRFEAGRPTPRRRTRGPCRSYAARTCASSAQSPSVTVIACVCAGARAHATQVGVTLRSGRPRILLDSSMILRSSPLMPLTGSTGESWLNRLNARTRGTPGACGCSPRTTAPGLVQRLIDPRRPRPGDGLIGRHIDRIHAELAAKRSIATSRITVEQFGLAIIPPLRRSAMPVDLGHDQRNIRVHRKAEELSITVAPAATRGRAAARCPHRRTAARGSRQ